MHSQIQVNITGTFYLKTYLTHRSQIQFKLISTCILFRDILNSPLIDTYICRDTLNSATDIFLTTTVSNIRQLATTECKNQQQFLNNINIINTKVLKPQTEVILVLFCSASKDFNIIRLTNLLTLMAVISNTCCTH